MLNLTIKIRLHLQKSSHLFFSPKIAIFVLAKRAGGRKTVQNDGRRCGDRNRKPLQFVDIHRAYIRAEAPLSRTFQSPFGDFFCERICAKKENFNLYINTLQSNLRSSSGAKLFR